MNQANDLRRMTIASSLLLLGTLSGWLSGCKEPAPTTRPRVESTFQVKGMTCGGCEQTIIGGVGKLPGVGRVRASHPQERAWVTYEAGRVTAEQITATIKKLGYRAALLKTSNPQD